MRRGRALVASGLWLLGVSVGIMSEAGVLRMIVADLPYGQVWEAALEAVHDYPIERAADGVIVTGWKARSPRAGESGFERVVERVTLRVEPRGERITRVTVEVGTRGQRDGDTVDLPDREVTAREILARLRAAEGEP